MRPSADEGRPAGNQAANTSFGGDVTSVRPATVTIADLSAWAESCRGRFMVEVEIGQNGQLRTLFYANVRAAERCVQRARARGAGVRVALVQTMPVGVLQGFGGA